MEHGSHFRALLAEVLMKDKQSDEGLAVVNEALNAALSAGGFHFLAELYRLKGELLRNCELGLLDRGSNEAEECFHQFIRIANYETQTKNTAGDLGNSPKDRARAA